MRRTHAYACCKLCHPAPEPTRSILVYRSSSSSAFRRFFTSASSCRAGDCKVSQAHWPGLGLAPAFSAQPIALAHRFPCPTISSAPPLRLAHRFLCPTALLPGSATTLRPQSLTKPATSSASATPTPNRRATSACHAVSPTPRAALRSCRAPSPRRTIRAPTPQSCIHSPAARRAHASRIWISLACICSILFAMGSRRMSRA